MSNALPIFRKFKSSIEGISIPVEIDNPFNYSPHPLALLACEELQMHLLTQQEWEHDFGLNDLENGRGGKMFGVLVVSSAEGEIGYLSAFSGKLAGGNHPSGFVPPIFDYLYEGSFLNKGMVELSSIVKEIESLEKDNALLHAEKIKALKEHRKQHSIRLQKELYDGFHFINKKGDWKSLREIFKDAPNSNPPGGAGECAAPKLFQYAFQNNLKPLALAEFFWGVAPKGINWFHKEYYTSCTDKCGPILRFMLDSDFSI